MHLDVKYRQRLHQSLESVCQIGRRSGEGERRAEQYQTDDANTYKDRIMDASPSHLDDTPLPYRFACTVKQVEQRGDDDDDYYNLQAL